MSSQCTQLVVKLRINFKLKFMLSLLILMSLVMQYNVANGRQRICGKALSDVLASVCVNGFNYRIKRCLERELEISKTSPPDDSWYYRLKDILAKMDADIAAEAYFRNSATYDLDNSDQIIGKQLLMRKRRQANPFRSRGVADECCTNGCVYADIIMYCA